MVNKPMHTRAIRWQGMLAKRRQRGAAMVEAALTMSLFMVLVIGIMEVSMLVFDWARAVEATRTAARVMVVNTPPVDVSTMDCSAAGSQITFNCGDQDCGAAVAAATAIAPMLEPQNLRVTFMCTSAGYPGRPAEMPVLGVTVQLEGFTSHLRIPAMIGFPADIPMPAFQTTRITEDLHTPAGE